MKRKIKLMWHRYRLTRRYRQYMRIRETLSCGRTLAHYLNPNLDYLGRKCEEHWSKILELR